MKDTIERDAGQGNRKKDTPVMIITTCKDEQEAERMARTLLDHRLIGCANLLPIRSLYRWEGKVEDEDEVMLILKSISAQYDRIAAAIKRLHSYTTPLIESVRIEEMDRTYRSWLESCLGADDQGDQEEP
ncbi:MAG: divalent-cation tolerance protein CutA [DPANN group archaeon]|nr:divalent-cation tolerance protein CutA [DPANN group archaeon]